jgi:hypothetical protein
MPLATVVVYVADRTRCPPLLTFKIQCPFRDRSARCYYFLATGCGKGTSERAGADCSNGIHRRRAARDIHPSRGITVRKAIGLVIAFSALAALAAS